MAVIPVKVFLFLLGGTAAAGATAYVAGVFDPLLDRRSAVSQTEPAQPDEKLAELPPAAMTEPPAPLDTDTTGKAEPGEDASGPVQQAPDGQPAQAPAGTPEAPAAGDVPAATGTGDASGAAPGKPETSAGSGAAGEKPANGDAGSAAEQEMAALPPDAASPEQELPPPVIAPSFDLVRVESNGSIVIAGQAAPNSYIEAVIGSRVIGTATAGEDGAFAIVLDEPLKPGDYQIVLRSRTLGNVVATSIETAVVSIPETEDGQVLALVEEPGKPAELITVPKPATPPDAAAAAGAAGQDAPPKPEETTSPAGQAPDATGNQTAAGGSPAETPAQGTAETQPPPAPAAGPAASGPRLAVEAIEIEGRQIFIAGMADPRRLLRAYANDVFLGEATASTAGRFLVEAERDLPVGDYIIRVDALEPNGGKVVARAAVPFEREPGENMAAVAPPAHDGASDGTTPKGDRLAAPAEAEATSPDGTPVNEDAGLAAQGVASTPPGTSVEPAGTPAPDTDALADVAAATDSASASDQMTATAPARQPDASDTEPAKSDVAVAPATADVPPAGADTLSPKLQNVDSAVIIRRGDTLWRISRRVYGRGVRYSTIYLANQDQIQNPHLILPGQVFKVPDSTEEGEPADLTQMGDQAVEPPPAQ